MLFLGIALTLLLCHVTLIESVPVNASEDYPASNKSNETLTKRQAGSFYAGRRTPDFNELCRARKPIYSGASLGVRACMGRLYFNIWCTTYSPPTRYRAPGMHGQNNEIGFRCNLDEFCQRVDARGNIVKAPFGVSVVCVQKSKEQKDTERGRKRKYNEAFVSESFGVPSKIRDGAKTFNGGLDITGDSSDTDMVTDWEQSPVDSEAGPWSVVASQRIPLGSSKPNEISTESFDVAVPLPDHLQDAFYRARVKFNKPHKNDLKIHVMWGFTGYSQVPSALGLDGAVMKRLNTASEEEG